MPAPILSRYEEKPDYAEEHLERIVGEEDEDLTHPDDVTAEQCELREEQEPLAPVAADSVVTTNYLDARSNVISISLCFLQPG
ncbi:MAG: hypothetical protein M3317_10160 [Actinomycetota bacterium]|nr:hypothetical protein [Actinomycetota bacterium]